MKQQRVYIDTSVVGGCRDEEFAQESRALLEMARNGLVVLLVSDLLFRELGGAPREVVSVLEFLPPAAFEGVYASKEAERLRDEYLAAGVVGPLSTDDALHVAIATVHRADLILSWNFKHIVHVEKIRGFNAVNLREGYPPIDIRSPRELT